MAIPPKFNPTISRQSAGNKATIVIKKQEKDNEVAGGEAPKGSGGSQDHDAYLRRQVLDVAETAAGGVKETKRGSALVTDLGPAAAEFTNLPPDVFDIIAQHLGREDLCRLGQTSKQLRNNVENAENNAKKQLPSLIEKLNRLILESGIAGIQRPEFLFTNPIKQLGVLETLEKNLPNAINILKNHKIEDLNARDENGNTPLHEAAIDGYPDVVKALIAAGAAVNATDCCGFTPLHLAAFRGHTDVVKILRAAQNTPLVAAANGGTEEFNLENTLSPETIQ